MRILLGVVSIVGLAAAAAFWQRELARRDERERLRPAPYVLKELAAAADLLAGALVGMGIAATAAAASFVSCARAVENAVRSFSDEAPDEPGVPEAVSSGYGAPTVPPEVALFLDASTVSFDERYPLGLEECWRCYGPVPRDDELGLCSPCRDRLRALEEGRDPEVEGSRRAPMFVGGPLDGRDDYVVPPRSSPELRIPWRNGLYDPLRIAIYRFDGTAWRYEGDV